LRFVRIAAGGVQKDTRRVFQDLWRITPKGNEKLLPYLAKEGEMTDQELHKVFEKRLPTMKSHINYYSEGKEDLKQEGMLGIWESLRKDPGGTDRFLKNNSRWKMIMSIKKGKSIDSLKSASLKNQRLRPVEIIRTDAVAEEVKEFILEDRSLPVDEKVIGKMAFERFVDSLNNLEKRFVLSKLREELRDKLYKELGQYKFMATYRACRQKFCTAFEC
jgi:hypothetical protein